MWDSLGGDRTVRNANAELLPPKGSNAPGGPAYEFLRETARAAKVHVHGGSIIEKGPEKLFNTTVVFDPDGQEIARYRKMHLFDIVAPDGTGYRESNTYGAGDEVVTYEADGMKVGCAICYDLRFPDLFWKLREQGAEVIFLPSAFTLATGKDHWEVMIRSRAIETQCWFAAPATWGKHLEGKGEARFTYGHSMIVDPVGPRGRQGVGRHRLGHGAHRPEGHRARAPRHAGAGTPEARLNAPEPVVAGGQIAGLRRGPDRLRRLGHGAGDGGARAAGRRAMATARWSGPRWSWPLGGDGFMLETIHRVLPLQHPGLRHELRLGRLPDEHVQRGRPAGPAGARAGGGAVSAAHARGQRRWRGSGGAGVQRGVAAASAAPDLEDPRHGGRPGAAAGADRATAS